jgi:hypothetical protein
VTCFGGVLRFCRLSHVTSEIGPRILGVHGAHIGYANTTRPCCQRSVVMESVARGGERLVPWMSLPQSVNSSTACVSHVSIVFIITTPIYNLIQLLHADATYMKHESILCRPCPCAAGRARRQVHGPKSDRTETARDHWTTQQSHRTFVFHRECERRDCVSRICLVKERM